MERKIIIENISSGYLTIDVANAFAESGLYDEVILFTGKVNIRPTKPLESVIIKKTINYHSKTVFLRLLTTFIAFVHFMIWTLFKNNNYEYLLVSTIPFITFLPELKRKKYSLLIYDVHPDSMVASKIFSSNSWINKKWESKNRIVYAHSQKVFAISNSMKNLLTKYVSENKIDVIYNWSHNEFLTNKQINNNPFVEQFGLSNCLVVLYSGALGINLMPYFETLLNVAEILRDNNKIKFVIIGEGQIKQGVIKIINSKNLSNCLVLPFQPFEMLPYSMGAADISFMPISPNMGSVSIPSKFNSYISAGSSILCITDKTKLEIEISLLIKDNQIGQTFYRENIEEIVNYLLEIAEDQDYLCTMKKNALKLSQQYTPSSAKKFVFALNK